MFVFARQSGDVYKVFHIKNNRPYKDAKGVQKIFASKGEAEKYATSINIMKTDIKKAESLDNKWLEEANKSVEISPETRHAVKHGLFDSFRYCSDMFFQVILEAKKNIGRLDIREEDLEELISSDAGTFGLFEDHYVPLDLPLRIEEFSKAEYNGKEVELNKPSKGDVKKFKVFVRDPKTGKVKKINFSASVSRELLEDPKRRKAFTARHNCEQAKDKLTPRYWACRVNKFYHKIFGGSPIGGVYW
jgi:hypothetical protein